MRRTEKMAANFAVFILTHGRPKKVLTYKTLRHHGYTGPIYIVIDNEDQMADEYCALFGDKVFVINKRKIAMWIDEGDNFEDRRAIIYARNACFILAQKLGLDYFIELDDDYYVFCYRTEAGGKIIRNLDRVFRALVDFLSSSEKISSVAFSQGGDHIGGYDPTKQVSRKAMNSFVCATRRPFIFSGRINEDVNTYINLGGRGQLFFTIMNIQLDQKDTQSNSGGMTELYLESGTYIKSFYSVMYNPSCVSVGVIRGKHVRLHHRINWGSAVPVIIEEKYRKVEPRRDT
jgi:hypothetical protein